MPGRGRLVEEAVRVHGGATEVAYTKGIIRCTLRPRQYGRSCTYDLNPECLCTKPENGD
jgi:hypothetical protein